MSGMVKPQMLWDSLFHRYSSTLAYSGTSVDGFEPINAVDWRDFSLFSSAAGSKTLKIQVSAAEPIDTAVIWAPAGLASDATVVLASSPDNVTYTTLATIPTNTLGNISWVSFTGVTIPVSGWLRFTIASASATNWRQMSVGLSIQAPTGQWANVAPTGLFSGVIMENLISVNGSIIGRNQRRIQKTGQLALNYLPQAWVRTTWENFARHAAKKAFWYRWDATNYPADVAFAVASSIQAPMNDRPPPFMKVEMPLDLLT